MTKIDDNSIEYNYLPDRTKLSQNYSVLLEKILAPLATIPDMNNAIFTWQRDSITYTDKQEMSLVKYTEYNGNIIYENGRLTRVLFPGGYCTFEKGNNNPTFHYFTQDHLGNNRTLVNEDGTVEQITHYYPFGGTFNDAGINPELQQYKYNGKELNRTLGLDTYDYGARQYFPALPTWDRVDSLCEKEYHVSPYAYCRNNPMKFIDNDGRKIIFASGSTEIFKQMFNQAISYLKQNSCDDLYQTLDKAEEIFIMHEVIGNTANSFSYIDGIIDWNPTKGLYTTFTTLSPTVLLNHEFDHAVEWLKSPNDYSDKIRILPDNDIDADYHTLEDKRVITGSEKETAKKLGELDDSTDITRLDHGGVPVKTVSPTSNQTYDELPGVTIYR